MLMIDIYVFIIFILLLFLFRKYICLKCVKNSIEIEQMSNIVNFYEHVSSILTISKCDFVAFFKYDYSKRYITTNFIFSLDKNYKINRYTEYGTLPVTINEFSLKVLNSDNSDIYEVYKHDIIDNPVSLRGIYKDTYKIYWQNIFKDKINPLGFIVIAYDNDYNISKRDKSNITENIKKISQLI